MKTLGILGGMGPAAGAYFYERVVALTSAEKDGVHIPVILVGDPRIPDRTAHLCGNGASPLPALLRGLLRLRAAGAEVIAMPCNTAHAYLPLLRGEFAPTVLHMPALAVRYACHIGARSLGVLSTRGTQRAGIYQTLAEKAGLPLFTLPAPSAEQLETLIYRQKAGEEIGEEEYRPFADRLLSAGADRVILACTEISWAYRGARSEGVVDALEVLARAAISACGGMVREEAHRLAVL